MKWDALKPKRKSDIVMLIFFALLFTSLFVFWQISQVTKRFKVFRVPEFAIGMRNLIYGLYLIDLIFTIILFDFIYLRVAYGYVLPLELRVITMTLAIAVIALLAKALVYFSPTYATSALEETEKPKKRRK